MALSSKGMTRIQIHQRKVILEVNRRIKTITRSQLESYALNYLHQYGVESFDPNTFTAKDFVLAKNFLEMKSSTVSGIRDIIQKSEKELEIDDTAVVKVGNQQKKYKRKISYKERQRIVKAIWDSFSDFQDIASTQGVAFTSNQILEEANKIIVSLGTDIRKMPTGEITAHLVKELLPEKTYTV